VSLRKKPSWGSLGQRDLPASELSLAAESQQGGHTIQCRLMFTIYKVLFL